MMPEGGEPIGTVLALAIKSGRGAAMREVGLVRAVEGAGLSGDVPASPRRGITLLSLPQWRQVMAELAADRPWHTRRANLLLDCERLGPLIGRTLRIGQARVRVEGETKPCDVMDAQLPGLRTALAPECRGGVHVRILDGGVIRVGDAVTAEPASAADRRSADFTAPAT